MDDRNRLDSQYQQNKLNEQKPLDLDNRHDEETAAEIMDPDVNKSRSDDRNDADMNNVYGWIAVALSIISFFFVPILFAGAGIILGFIARNREAPVLGYTAIAISIISILVRLFIMPLI